MREQTNAFPVPRKRFRRDADDDAPGALFQSSALAELRNS
jgi:hypothetical protein